MATFSHQFFVQPKAPIPFGPKPFPLDMLTYDGCYPAANPEGNVRVIQETFNIMSQGEPKDFKVCLVHVHGTKTWTPTRERWLSFGWEVVQVLTPMAI